MSAWKDDFIIVNQYTRPAKKLKEVRKLILHYTANPGASAYNHKRYFGESLIAQNERLPEEAKRYASAHLFIDKLEAICIVPLDEITFAANDIQKYVNGKPYRGVPELLPNANYLSVSVELCIEKDGTFHPDTIKRAEDVFAELCKMFNLDPIKDIVTHQMVTAKQCPRPWIDKNEQLFVDFKNRVNEKLNPPKQQTTIEEDEIVELTGALKIAVRNELEMVTDEKKYGKSALNKSWLTKFDEGSLKTSELLALMIIVKQRGM
jgi:N-acetylmuramoyl-L-alanine amidase